MVSKHNHPNTCNPFITYSCVPWMIVPARTFITYQCSAANSTPNTKTCLSYRTALSRSALIKGKTEDPASRHIACGVMPQASTHITSAKFGPDDLWPIHGVFLRYAMRSWPNPTGNGPTDESHQHDEAVRPCLNVNLPWSNTRARSLMRFRKRP